MFGHQDGQSDAKSNDEVNAIDAAVAALPGTDDHQGQENNDQGAPAQDPVTAHPGDPAPNDGQLPQPSQDPSTADAEYQNSDVLSPAGGFPIHPSDKVHKFADENGADNDLLDTSGDDLAALKVQALDELYPLFDKLDLEPEDKFKTLMMMIQASDNQELIKSAYEAAHSIPDDKEKAQALLDIVNEINYFTQHPAVEN